MKSDEQKPEERNCGNCGAECPIEDLKTSGHIDQSSLCQHWIAKKPKEKQGWEERFDKNFVIKTEIIDSEGEKTNDFDYFINCNSEAGINYLKSFFRSEIEKAKVKAVREELENLLLIKDNPYCKNRGWYFLISERIKVLKELEGKEKGK